MKISIIIPSYLGDYPTASTDRENKLIRAVSSALNQTYKDIEIIVIADKCNKTMEIMALNFTPSKKLGVYHINYEVLSKKHILFTGMPRNTGLKKATGNYVMYLDIDDMYEPDHVENVVSQLNGEDWVWFDDQRWSKKGEWYVNSCDIDRLGKCGTSNICHKNGLDVWWLKENIYGKDDWYFINRLKKYNNFTKINASGYKVCHIPKQSGIGYDV